MSQIAKPQLKKEKSQLELLEESLSSIIDDMSFSSHSEAILERESKMQSEQQHPLKPHVDLLGVQPSKGSINMATPIQADFRDISISLNPLNVTPPVLSNITDLPNFAQMLINTGYSSYIMDFQHTGVTSISELIRFATQYLPPSLNVTPGPNGSSNSFPYTEDEKSIQINTQSQEHKAEHKETKAPKPETPIRTGRNRKHKLRLYEVEELLEDDVYCEYALLIRDGGNSKINGYYTCSGKKNDHYMFNHMQDNLAALYCWTNGTWMIAYDDELLYGNPLKYDRVGGRDILMLAELNLYPPPPRCWYAIEAINPPPGVMWLEITDDPMAFIDEELASRTKQHNLNEKYMNKLKVDLPVQMIDFMFCGPIGFALRIDAESKVMDVIRIREDGQAMELGLQHGDTLLKINEEEISTQPEIAFPMLKECVQSDEAFEVTFLRKKFDELVINVQRAGSPQCNGKYVCSSLDEYDAPIFVKENDREMWKILRLDHDDQEGQSIWAIQNMKENSEYYIGYSETYAPPNNAWETVEEVAKNPAPGLQFIAVDNNVMNKLVPDEPKVRQNIFVGTKRRYKHRMQQSVDDEDKIQDGAVVGLNSFKLQIFEQQQRENDTLMQPGYTPLSMSGSMNSDQYQFTPSPKASRSDSVMSTIYAIPDEVQSALVEYQYHITNLEKELKVERKRAVTLTHQHRSQQTMFKEQAEKLQIEKEEFGTRLEWFRDELYTVNNAYYHLWIKQSDARLEYHKVNKESYKTKGRFAQTKKQLFQAKRKIDDLQDDVEELQTELEAERLKSKNKKSVDKTEDDIFSMDLADIDIIELKTEIGFLKAQLAARDIDIEELNTDNDKWQEAHDSIFERMTEAHTRLAREIEEFAEAKTFYERKLSMLRDQIQDNSIQFYEYEKRINDISKQYEKDTEEKLLPAWNNKPKIQINISEEKRVSITFGGGKNKHKRDSLMAESGGWANLTPRTADIADQYAQHDTLYDDEEPLDSEEDANNAFGFTTTFIDSEAQFDIEDEEDEANGAFGAFGANDDEFECEEDDDDVTNAFGS